MKNYLLDKNFTSKVHAGSGEYDFETGKGIYWGNNGIIIMYSGIWRTDNSRYLTMYLIKEGIQYKRAYSIYKGITERGILLLAKKFQDEIFKPIDADIVPVRNDSDLIFSSTEIHQLKPGMEVLYKREGLMEMFKKSWVKCIVRGIFIHPEKMDYYLIEIKDRRGYKKGAKVIDEITQPEDFEFIMEQLKLKLRSEWGEQKGYKCITKEDEKRLFYLVPTQNRKFLETIK